MRRVLLLNVTYEPLTTVGLRRAVCLVLCGKAEVVHGDTAGAVLHAATVSLATPSVIRLSRYVRVPYRNRVPLTRAGLRSRWASGLTRIWVSGTHRSRAVRSIRPPIVPLPVIGSVPSSGGRTC